MPVRRTASWCCRRREPRPSSRSTTTTRSRSWRRAPAIGPDGLENARVRAVRRVRQYLDRGGRFPEIPSGKVYTYYYASSFTTPWTFAGPWLVLRALRDLRFEEVATLGARATGVRYWD